MKFPDIKKKILEIALSNKQNQKPMLPKMSGKSTTDDANYNTFGVP